MTVLGVLLGVTIFACAITMLRPGNVLPVRSSGIWFGGFGLLSGLLGGLFSAGGPRLCTTSTDSPWQWKPCGPPWSPR